MRTRIFLISLISFVWLFGCDGTKSHWRIAQEQNTTFAYEYFLKAHPQHQLAELARSKLEELYFKEAHHRNNISAYERFLEK